ncbi:FAD/NAD(P)-binding protein [Hoeflea ulvae]|uniref:FAD/NAD(P)-binding protein n=1 Tax=Hoeflea ulvae TaxID=2983764 RepID=A0ABT3YBC5_9HYPH|nr:FAD/NAD(P)-binding protein [Hoeflea ulvae]MCY0093163.1 FAD/NAD(P)-binding protein [Hoeflea ulvae]
MTPVKLAIIGAGPTTVYLLKHLIGRGQKLDIAIYEASPEAGKGMPYREDINADYMLCNAFSREIPELTRQLIDWLETRPKYELSEWELSEHDISARAFYPRVLIGEFLHDEFHALIDHARATGHKITLHTSTPVTDIDVTATPGQALLLTRDAAADALFDAVIIATGHSWPKSPHIDQADLLSPWPATRLESLEAGHIGILGSSLSAIDVVAALGHAHGTFDESGDHVRWTPNDAASGLRITMVSRMGIMPEGDFYYPFPYQPLACITQAAVSREIERGSDGLLARVFDLLCQELDHADPAYLENLGPEARTIPGFSQAYFRHRQQLGGLEAVERDFAKTRQSMRKRQTIAHRYALLRGHENFDAILRRLDEADWKLFHDELMPVFADCYAAVPHLSLSRIIALHQAGILTLVATGDDATFENTGETAPAQPETAFGGPAGEPETAQNTSGVTPAKSETAKAAAATKTPDAKTPDAIPGPVKVTTPDATHHFDIMIDARGQPAASLDDLPFTTLTRTLTPQTLRAPFRLDLETQNPAKIYCLAMPQLLDRHPFAQGLVNVAELAEVVAGDVCGEG